MKSKAWQRRKNQPVTEIASACPICKKMGQVKHSGNNGTVSMFCIDCSTNWQSLAERCSVCGKYNGYVVPGMCKKCYEKKQGDRVDGK